jgi:small subunit ribosomal protein S13
MLILFGKKLDETKKVEYALKSVFGIGISSAKKICRSLSIAKTITVADLTEHQKLNISTYIKQNFNVELKLKQQVSENIETQISLNTLKGFRHRSNLPVRGQRTHSNAQTCKRVKMLLTK